MMKTKFKNFYRAIWILGVLFFAFSFQSCQETPQKDKSWGQQGAEVSISRLSDAFRYSPSSQFAPGDGGVDLDWVDGKDLEVVKVTTLASEGKGSLRWALEEKTGLRLVVFEVGGVIDLERKRLKILPGHGNVIVAGQTAPYPGITLIRDAVDLRARNVIVQHIRVRPGDDIVGKWDIPDNEGYSVDAMELGDQGNQIVDHCSFTWASDETVSVSQSRDHANYEYDPGLGNRPAVTISNNIIADGLRYCDLHPSKRHDKGTLLHQGFEHYLMGNLWANVEERTPLVGGRRGSETAIINNLMHNIDHEYNTIKIAQIGQRRAAVIGNTFSDETKSYWFENHGSDEVKIYLHDNDYKRLVDGNGPAFVDEPPVSLHSIKPIPKEDVFEHAIQTIGARPAERTPLDERTIRQLKEGWGEYIDSQDDVGGYPEFEPVHRPLNVPADPTALGEWLYQYTRAVELPGAMPPQY